MGYYTRHELTVINGGEDIDYEQEIGEFSGCDYIFGNEIKWYDCEKDMIKFSKTHPNVTFLIDGEGEESGDIWKHWFKNGKSFRCKVQLVFEEFSEDKLQ